jgi:mRNA interferase HigB
MIITGRDILAEAARKYRGQRLDKALNAWIKVAENARWRRLPDLKQSWPSANPVSGYVVFDIKGNQFRLVAHVSYKIGVVTGDEGDDPRGV